MHEIITPVVVAGAGGWSLHALLDWFRAKKQAKTGACSTGCSCGTK